MHRLEVSPLGLLSVSHSVCLSVCLFAEDAAPAGAVLRPGCAGLAQAVPLVSQCSDPPRTERLPWPGRR